ncbi:hypothetical protein [Donghicola tyrosinivorans]|uniref:Uncharacterized protein n=1 Tax=Donghicola tyrosinivorans TaxID=1652492 RepID=A0A2T0WH60_9RHOB|nr:hypothetical protein [Donghicola tyrosinivorans]PRY86047.1 hypothetical protein CLV74_11322 [Donghicola tyrosinivorans]
MKIFSKCAVAVLASALSTSAIAQSGFPDGFPAHVSGVAIGDTHDSVEPKIREALLPDIQTVEINPDYTAKIIKRGTNFNERKVSNPLITDPLLLEFGGNEAVMIRNRLGYEPEGEYFYVTYSSPSSGSGVETISRRVIYDEPLNLDALIAKLKETYGEPTEQKGRYLRWAFNDGKAMSDLPYNCQFLSQSPRRLQDMNKEGRIRVNTPQLYFTGGNNRGKPCDAFLMVSYGQDQNGNVPNVEFLFIDHLKMWNDQEAFMQVLIDAQEKANAAKPKGNTKVGDF